MMVSSIPTLSSKMLMRSKDSSHLRSISYLRSALKIIGAIGAIWCLECAHDVILCGKSGVRHFHSVFLYDLQKIVERKLNSKQKNA